VQTVHDKYEDAYSQFENVIGYSFHDRALLEEALTHRSRANEVQGKVDNQRLEFFGDAILGFLISHLLFNRFPDAREGELSHMRAALVDEARLSAIAMDLGIGPCLQLGRGEERSGGREKRSILADAYEALLAAVFLDGGMAAVRNVIEKHFAGFLGEFALSGMTVTDYKTELQEYTQAASGLTPTYELTAAEGPDHDRTYRFTVFVNGVSAGVGEGKSKKEAQQAAAREALESLQK
jgi:ribonuclease III